MNFSDAISDALEKFSPTIVPSSRWQGVDISSKPEMAMHEVLFHTLQVDLPNEDLDHYRLDIQPNLPWADDHFMERVCGEPLNPGKTWSSWPYSQSANKFRDANGQFNHNYMERYWPKYAGRTVDGTLEGTEWDSHTGIRHEYADLKDLIQHLHKDPLTRQAYMPVWFPEDGSHDDRKPCTLGYHFIMRDDKLHTVYYIRSCDFIRHFRDDIYLTVRLTLYILNWLRSMDEKWNSITPGKFIMHITSLHMFRNDYLSILRSIK